jgi:hypothetical protein
MGDLLTQADFAKRRGVGKSAVSNWKKAGLLVFAEDADGRMMVDARRTEARLNSRLDPTRGRPTAATQETAAPLPLSDDAGDPGAGQERNLARVRAEVAEEDLVDKRLKNAARARELVPAAEAERRVGALGQMVRERIQAELRAKAERLAAEREPRAIMALLDEAVDRGFLALAKAVAGGSLDDLEEDGEEVAAEAA